MWRWWSFVGFLQRQIQSHLSAILSSRSTGIFRSLDALFKTGKQCTGEVKYMMYVILPSLFLVVRTDAVVQRACRQRLTLYVGIDHRCVRRPPIVRAVPVAPNRCRIVFDVLTCWGSSCLSLATVAVTLTKKHTMELLPSALAVRVFLCSITSPVVLFIHERHTAGRSCVDISACR